MKKLFLGCGLVVLAAGAALVWFLAPMWSEGKEMATALEALHARLLALDEAHPFDPQAPLDRGRFEAALAVREELAPLLQRIDALAARRPADEAVPDLGVREQIVEAMRTVKEGFERFGRELDEAAMGPTEFGHHTRLLWAALGTIDAGLGDGDPRLDPLRGRWRELKEAYPELRQRDSSLPQGLDDLVGDFDPAATTAAREVLAQQPERVLASLADPGTEVLVFMRVQRLTPETVMPLPDGAAGDGAPGADEGDGAGGEPAAAPAGGADADDPGS